MKKRRITLALASLASSSLSYAAYNADHLNVTPQVQTRAADSTTFHDRAVLQDWADKRLDALREKLALHPEQETAWQAYRTAMQQRAADRIQSFPHYVSAWAEGSQAILLSRIRAHEENVAQTVAETERFYRQLTRRQQQIFDAETLPG